jgi:hypothetical protein
MSRWSILAALSLTAVAVSLSLTISAISKSSVPLRRIVNETNANQEQPTRMEAELLVLRAEGFHPKEITRPAGRFLLVIQNHSTAEEISLVLKQERGAAMREVRTTRRQSKLNEFVDLPPGRYVLSEVNHPDWSCTIIITSN